MSNPQIPGPSQSTKRSNTSEAANQMLKNPAVIALAAAFGLVVIATVIATIMGIVEDMEKKKQGTAK